MIFQVFRPNTFTIAFLALHDLAWNAPDLTSVLSPLDYTLATLSFCLYFDHADPVCTYHRTFELVVSSIRKQSFPIFI